MLRDPRSGLTAPQTGPKSSDLTMYRRALVLPLCTLAILLLALAGPACSKGRATPTSTPTATATAPGATATSPSQATAMPTPTQTAPTGVTPGVATPTSTRAPTVQGATPTATLTTAPTPTRTPTPTATPSGIFVPIPTPTPQVVISTPVPTPGPGTPATTPTPGPTPTPTPIPVAADGAYTSSRYWYTAKAPQGWTVEAASAESVTFSDSGSSATARITFQRIDPEKYPSLDRLIGEMSPTPAPEWSGFFMSGPERAHALMPNWSARYTYDYKQGNTQRRGIEDWYLLGPYLAKVSIQTDSVVWALDQWATLRQRIVDFLDKSFQPAVQTNTSAGYSLALPPGWKLLTMAGYDYCAADPTSVTGRICVQLASAPGNPNSANLKQYGDGLTIPNANVLSRTLVYLQRPNQAYRIDFERPTSGVPPTRGVAIVTLARDQAFWFVAEYPKTDWDRVQGLVDEILMRATVRP